MKTPPKPSACQCVAGQSVCADCQNFLEQVSKSAPPDDFEARRDAAAEIHANPEGVWDYGDGQQIASFKAGADWAREDARKHEDELIPLIELERGVHYARAERLERELAAAEEQRGMFAREVTSDKLLVARLARERDELRAEVERLKDSILIQETYLEYSQMREDHYRVTLEKIGTSNDLWGCIARAALEKK